MSGSRISERGNWPLAEAANNNFGLKAGLKLVYDG